MMLCHTLVDCHDRRESGICLFRRLSCPPFAPAAFGTRLFPWLLKQVEHTGSRKLFTLAVIALALDVAFGSARLF
jgi:hypothetical protein